MRILSLFMLGFVCYPSHAAPNVLFILTDDQRWDCLSAAGHPHLKTPNLDRITKEGIHFQNAFCTTSLCSPSRASILSGLYACQHGVRNNFTEFPEKIEGFPSRLQQHGYKTAYIGKWHMGEENDDRRKGFDHFITHKGQGKYYDTEFRINGGERKVIPGYYTNVVTDLALDWLQKQDKPFCLMVGHKAPHSFYIPEKKYATSFDEVAVPYPNSAFQLEDKPAWFKTRLNTWHGIYGPLFDFRKKFPDSRPEAVKDFAAMTRAYWGTILSVDDSVGRLLKYLEKAGKLDDTIIIFAGDNGLLNGEHGMVDKRTMHEPSIRVPLLVRYPKLVNPQHPKKNTPMVLHADLAPSILELCQAKPLDNIAGKSWVKMVQSDDPDWRKSFVYEYNYEKQFPYTPNVRGIRTDEWKLIRYPHGDGSPDRHLAELYHLKSDPNESKNLIANPKYKSQIEQLEKELVRQMSLLGPEIHKMPIDAGILSTLPDLSIR